MAATLNALIIPVTAFQQNCTVLFDSETKQGVVVDPGGDVDHIREALDKNGITVDAIWLTHGHIDHAGGAMDLKEALGVEIVGPHKDDKMLLDGFSLDSVSYTTLFDHPDKYTEFYNFGESSKVYRNKHHWRMTQSTTMTFVARMRDLRKHWKIWDEYTSGQHPHDHHIFTKILEEYGGQLSCAIPGLSVHTALSVSIGMGKVLMEPWALEMACESLAKQATELVDDAILESVVACTEPGTWDRIKILNALVQTPLA